MITKAGFAEDFPQPDKDRQVSASQLRTYKSCNRKWGFKYLDKLPDPPGAGALFGTAVHKEYEAWFRDGIAPNPTTRAGRLAQRGLDSGHYPDPACVSGVEPHIMFEAGGVRFHGFVDLVEDSTIHDHKTGSDPKKYALTAETIKKDEQALIYSTWGLALWGNSMVALQWTYHSTRTKALFPVRAEMERDETYRDFEQHCLIPAQELLRDRKKHTTGNDLPVNLSECSNYGGCKFAMHCQRTPEQIIIAADESTGTMGLKDLLAKNQGTKRNSKGQLPPPRVTELVAEQGHRERTSPIPNINSPEGPSNVETQRAVSRVVETTGGGPKAAKATNRNIAVAAQGETDPDVARDVAETAQRDAQADLDARKAASLTPNEAIRICLKDPEGIAIFSNSKAKATAVHPYFATRTLNKAVKEGLLTVIDRDDGLKSVTVTDAGRAAVSAVETVTATATPSGLSSSNQAALDRGIESASLEEVSTYLHTGPMQIKHETPMGACNGSHARFLQRLLNNETMSLDEVQQRYNVYCKRFPMKER